MVTRRRFAVVLGAVALGPMSCLAQDRRRVRRIGFLSLDTAGSVAGQLPLVEFPSAMAKLGYREGRDLQPGPIAARAHELYMAFSRTQRII